MREVTFNDGDGCRYKTLIPDEAPDTEAEMGIRVGPPELDSLELPASLLVRLNNQLFDRGLFTKKDIRRRMPELQAALQAALSVDAQRLQAIYESEG